jgi:hypothetical protein
VSSDQFRSTTTSSTSALSSPGELLLESVRKVNIVAVAESSTRDGVEEEGTRAKTATEATPVDTDAMCPVDVNCLPLPLRGVTDSGSRERHSPQGPRDPSWNCQERQCDSSNG